MSFILGLDISTSIVGWCILDKKTGGFTAAGAIDLKKEKCVYKKAGKVSDVLSQLKGEYSICEVVIEENLQAFRPGFSSAKTIVTLARFNGMVSLCSHNVFKLLPKFVNVNSARKLVGLKIDRKSTASTKEQVLSFVKLKIPKYDWPTRIMKSGPRKGLVLSADSCYDIADAFVIAKSCVIDE